MAISDEKKKVKETLLRAIGIAQTTFEDSIREAQQVRNKAMKIAENVYDEEMKKLEEEGL